MDDRRATGDASSVGQAAGSRVTSSLRTVFAAFLKLGLVSFGGPIAHLGYLRTEFVERRRWLDDAAYADLVALCKFLPGPASSQVGIALGALRAGLPGAVAAWVGFTLPSAAIMIAFGYGFQFFEGGGEPGWLHGLKIAAVAVVAQAVWSMGRQLTPDRARASVAVAAALLVLAWPSTLAQIAVIAIGGLIGWRLLPAADGSGGAHVDFRIGRRTPSMAWILFFGLLVLLPVLARTTGRHALALVDSFYRSGSLVFGGGHVVLPLLRAEVVPPGWISDEAFLAGYGMAQALPGPLFTFSAYLGTVMEGRPSGWAGGLLTLAAIFLPSFLLVLGALPHWNAWRRKAGMRAALNGINAAVVGILLAALYDPIFTSAVASRGDFALAAAAFALLVHRKASPLWVVLFAAGGGTLLALA
ncbi:chromate transporter [Sulfurifustis variabilis]|uniref:Chromate transporter n=1 Tax=Sulfurifustis variabilis TaxID=1675686 RepID=A0A1B4VB51_9GAMM|nr:chromate efflux transporter [Sulfurifustis variabilis]BAU49254.1 chromate transporter [Sulfurifustis variabilis]